MIIIKAGTKQKNVFTRLIQTTKENVEWGGNFVVAGGNLILLGRVKSLFFNFDTKNIHSNIIDLVVNEEKAEQTTDNDVLENVLNISMYAFGKWGKIAGLKVEKDYNQLNSLFQSILREIGATADIREDGLKFYKNGIQIAFEEVVQAAVDWAKQGTIDEGDIAEDLTHKEEYEVGLWHNLRWDKVTEQIHKSYVNLKDKEKSRFGRNFYMVDYCCPSCGEKLYMVVFPVHKEVRIETVEGRVLLARAYTCNTCNSYYTPTPGRLLAEGSLYCFHFEEDRKAYEDYADLLGEVGERCSNYKMNEFEADRNHETQTEPETKPQTLSMLLEEAEELPWGKLAEIMEKVDSGFYPIEDTKRYREKIEQQLIKKEKQAGVYQEREKEEEVIRSIREKARQKREKKNQIKSISSPNKKGKAEEEIIGAGNENSAVEESSQEETKHKEEDISQRSVDSVKRVESIQKIKNAGTTENVQTQEKPETVETSEVPQAELSPMSQLEYETDWRKKAQSCAGKPYQKIQEVIREIQQSEGATEAKAAVLFPLYEYRKKQAQKEAQIYLSKVPENINKKLYEALKEKLNEYEEEDVLPWIKLLDEKRDVAEHKEIGDYIKQSRAKEREELLQLHKTLGEQGFSQQNVTPYREKIYQRLCEMDQIQIDKICPQITEITFENGLEIYEEIAKGPFLPELKANTLDMIDKRLTKMKTDENGQLVRKLQKELQKTMSDLSKIHFYDARGIMRGDGDETEEKVMEKAVDTYGNFKNKYEYPIMIADSSPFHNGKEGIIITPDQIFYKSFFKEGSLKISEIEEAAENEGRFQKGILLVLKNGSMIKLPTVCKMEERRSFVKILGEYISYLQEKPESRNIAYLAKDKHEVKCCIRCGYTYKGGSICPKCGSKINR